MAAWAARRKASSCMHRSVSGPPSAGDSFASLAATAASSGACGETQRNGASRASDASSDTTVSHTELARPWYVGISETLQMRFAVRPHVSAINPKP